MSDALAAQHRSARREAMRRARGHRCALPGIPAAPRAFTLVEVLAALLLIAIVLPVVMQGISLATGAASSAKRRTEAASLAQSKLAELVATEGWRTGVLSGQFDAFDGDGAHHYGWRGEVGNWTEPYVKQLQVYVTWTGAGGGEEEWVRLTTLVYEGRPEEEETEPEATTPGAGGTRGGT